MFILMLLTKRIICFIRHNCYLQVVLGLLLSEKRCFTFQFNLNSEQHVKARQRKCQTVGVKVREWAWSIFTSPILTHFGFNFSS